MKKKSIFCYFLVLFFFLFTILGCSQTKMSSSDNQTLENSISQIQEFEKQKINLNGSKLCRQFQNFLEKNGFKTEKQPLIVSEANEFPFNIKISFPADQKLYSENFSEENLTNLTIAFCLEEAAFNSEITLNLLKTAKNLKLDYDLDFIFTYGDSVMPVLSKTLKGTQFFTSNLYNQRKMAVICVKLSSQSVQVVPGGGKDTSPTWLIKRITNHLNQKKIPYTLQSSNLTTLYRFGILNEDERTSCFLKEKIPCAGLILPLEPEFIASFISSVPDFFVSYSQKGTSQWDRHFYSITIGNHIFWITEQFITITFIILSILSLFVICMFSFQFQNKHLKPHVLVHWKLIPASIIVTLLGIYIAQLCAYITNLIFTIPPYPLLSIKLIITLLFPAGELYFIYKQNLIKSQEIYSYLATTCATFNIIFFSFVDISLFFLFVVQYIVIIISRQAKRIISISLFFILLIAPYIPYFVQFIQYVKESSITDLTFCNFFTNFGMTFAILPFELYMIRIAAKIIQIFRNSDPQTRKFQKQNLIAISSAFGIFTIIIFILFITIPEQFIIKNHEKTVPEVIAKQDDMIKVKFKDDTFFGETNRSLDIDLGMQAEQCLISLSSSEVKPVIYSDENYISNLESNTDFFTVPVWPPQKLSFKYITQTEKPTTLTVEAIYPSEYGDQYILRQHSIEIPAVN